MYVASRLLDSMTQPLAWVVLLLAGGLLLSRWWPRMAYRLRWSALAVLLLQGWEPLPDALLRRLEAQHPAPAQVDLSRFAGVIVLGGATESVYAWEGHAQPLLNEAGERLTAAIPLTQRAPQLKLLYSGGRSLGDTELTEAERARRFYVHQGVEPQRLLLEDQARTTHENAVLSARLPGVDKTQPWLLLTSAWHMPRSMAVFQKAGWNVTPWPTDFRTGIETQWTRYSLADGAKKWHTALHEYLGMWIYRLTDRA